ncbi:MAG: FAD:protein FMN transferase [Bacteroidales bacterium]|nr:FAD:protein FMN transferase [Bacteroidales bacterium]
MKKLLYFLVGILLLAGCSTKEQKISFNGLAQGTYYRVTYYAPDTLFSQAEIDSFFVEFDALASLWNPNSMISKINNNELTTVSTPFKRLFRTAQDVSKITNGALDCTIGNLVNAWGFGAFDSIKPSQIIIDSLLQYVGFQYVSIDSDNVIHKQFPETKLDFNAVAKGFSVDLLAQKMQNKGIRSLLIDIGGEIFAYGQKPDGSNWVVGLEKPSKTAVSERELKLTLNLSNKAIATSGSYRKYYEKDGIRYSHTIDPATGYPVRHTLLSATVICEKCAVADAFATAFMVMGTDKVIEFLKQYAQLQVFLIYSDDQGDLKTWQTDGFKNLILWEY